MLLATGTLGPPSLASDGDNFQIFGLDERGAVRRAVVGCPEIFQITVMNFEIVPNHVHRTCRIAFSQGIYESQEIGFSPLSTAMAKARRYQSILISDEEEAQVARLGERPAVPRLRAPARLLA
jgi:hypothetical protein